jgi:hypothetical protein
VIESVEAGATTIESALVAVCVPSVTCAVKLNVPAEVGVPPIAPVETFNVSPGGRLPETSDQV